MTFRDVIFKNFTKGIQNYISYFLAGVFCSAMFFTYSTIILLDDVSESVEDYPMKLLFIITCMMISIFSVFFINYSHQNFVSKKKKELATYLVLGMREQDGMKLLFVESMLIACASMIVGMVTGCIISRLFQLIVIRLVGLEDIGYKLSIWNFMITCIVFLCIYLVCFILSMKQMKKTDVVLLIKDQRIKKSRPYRTLYSIATCIGILMMTFSAVFILHVASNHHINSKPWVVVTFLGTGYLGLACVILCGGKAWIHFLMKRRNYYKNMLTIKGIDFQYQQNMKIMIILAFLASMIVMLVGAPIALVTISSDIAEDGNHDIEYVITSGDKKTDIVDIIQQKEIKEDQTLPIHYVTTEDQKIKIIISVRQYQEWYHTALPVEKGQVYNLITTWVPGTNGINIGDELSVHTKDGTASFTVCDSVKNDWLCPNLIPSESILVISEDDYEVLQPSLNAAEIHLITYQDGWLHTKAIANEVSKKLEGKGYSNSRIQVYESLKHGYSVFLFVSCSMCFMFFVSTGFVLYFKQYNEIEEEKKLYVRLYSMGISDREMKKSISLKMSVVYFVPLLGSIMGILLMYYLSSLFGGGSITNIFMKKGVLGFVCYAVAQIVFYLILKFTYTRDVLSVNK